TALNIVAEGFKKARRESEDLNSIACLISPQSTCEEMALAQQLMKGIGSSSIDAGLRHADGLALHGANPWLGMAVEDFNEVAGIVVVGSDLRNDQPLLAHRIRQAAKQGVPVTLVGTGLNDPYMPKAKKIKAAPSALVTALDDEAVSSALSPQGKTVVLVGQQVLMSPYGNAVMAKAQDLAEKAGATFGFLGDGPNWVGSFIAGVQAGQTGGKTAAQILTKSSPAMLVFNTEPELDTLLGKQASATLHGSKFVVVASPYVGRATEYADVILPIAPNTETSGTFINIEGRAQTFKAACRPLGDCRPGWKVLRVLGNLLEIDGFDAFNKSTDVLDQFLPQDVKSVLSNKITAQASEDVKTGLELAAYASAYHVDSTVRRAASLQRTKAANAPLVQASQATIDAMGAQAGDLIKLTDSKGGELQAEISLNPWVADETLLVPHGREQAADLKTYFGRVQVEVMSSSSEVQA
ncbi:MAG: molybdopterin-dependent oxidoreductase, partial [Limnobacter sp.]|nr:molybdopterin-dependent oxidoreductase [Limnobacter sp.]